MVGPNMLYQNVRHLLVAAGNVALCITALCPGTRGADVSMKRYLPINSHNKAICCIIFVLNNVSYSQNIYNNFYGSEIII